MVLRAAHPCDETRLDQTTVTPQVCRHGGSGLPPQTRLGRREEPSACLHRHVTLRIGLRPAPHSDTKFFNSVFVQCHAPTCHRQIWLPSSTSASRDEGTAVRIGNSEVLTLAESNWRQPPPRGFNQKGHLTRLVSRSSAGPFPARIPSGAMCPERCASRDAGAVPFRRSWPLPA